MYSLKDLKINVDLKETNYEIDALQNELLKFYLRADRRFRQAYNLNYTNTFIQFMKDKNRLKEPLHISCIGNTRCQPKDSKVLMANGEWKNIQDIDIGDRVLSPQKDGFNIFCDVVGKSKHISKDNYTFYEKNGKNKELFTSSGNHIIPTWFRGTLRADEDRRINKKGHKRISNWYIDEREAKEFISMEHRSNFLISSFPIDNFENKLNPLIEPYTLGVYLGNGHFTESLGISNMENGVMDEVLKFYELKGKYGKKGTNCKTFSFGINSKLAKELFYLGLRYKKSGDKFIPKEALLSNIEFRRKLLAGLIDTDGYLSKECSYSICTKSEQMAKDILFLIYSLGGTASIHKIKKGIKKLNFIGEYYNIIFYLGKDIEKIPLKNVRKIRKKGKYWKLTANRTSFCVKKAVDSLVYGIELDSPSKLYITDNMIVTHNSGKSSAMMSVCVIHMLLNGKMMTNEYVCPNSYEFLERLKTMDEDKLKHSIFLIDEEKKAVFGYGSVAKKLKLTDVQNIIAVNNISTISLTPDSWANENANYGLRTFGRCFKTQSVRLMLYNLQGGGKSGETPMGMIYLPIFNKLLPKEAGDELNKEYLKAKQKWVDQEMRGEGDVLVEIKKRTAQNFMNDTDFLSLVKKNEKLTYITTKLGSEFTTKECGEILNITELLKKGINIS